jgi:hypothetical protein
MPLHSSYNPSREAERYVDAIQFSNKPLYIVVTEPGESWLAVPLRKKFPDALLLALRYTDSEFRDTDQLWDGVWRPGSTQTCQSFLFNIISDEYLPLTSFVAWKPSDAAWPEISISVWNAIAQLIALQKTVMHTRTHFGKRWLVNMLRNVVFVETVMELDAPDKPVFLACAGPSLEKNLSGDYSELFVCSVSSALSSLISHGHTPDLCFATDGGNWALSLFDDLSDSIPVAFPLEAAIPSRVRERNACVMLDYGSVLESELLSMAGVRGKKARRNGTVAGTAADFFIEHSNVPIYAAGLDLCVGTAYSHARPHPSLNRLETTTQRMKPLCGEVYARSGDVASLDAYSSWFSSRNSVFKSRFFRLEPVSRSIEGIETVSMDDIQFSVTGNKPLYTAQKITEKKLRIESVQSYLEQFRERADRCLQIKNDSEKASVYGSELDVSAGKEMLQMISYTGYVNCLKSSRALETGSHNARLTEGIDKICSEVITFTDSFLAKVRIP